MAEPAWAVWMKDACSGAWRHSVLSKYFKKLLSLCWTCQEVELSWEYIPNDVCIVENKAQAQDWKQWQVQRFCIPHASSGEHCLNSGFLASLCLCYDFLAGLFPTSNDSDTLVPRLHPSSSCPLDPFVERELSILTWGWGLSSWCEVKFAWNLYVCLLFHFLNDGKMGCYYS